jgi:hypothetical protein
MPKANIYYEVHILLLSAQCARGPQFRDSNIARRYYNFCLITAVRPISNQKRDIN